MSFIQKYLKGRFLLKSFWFLIWENMCGLAVYSSSISYGFVFEDSAFFFSPLHVWSSCDLVLHFMLTFSTILIYTSVSSTIFPTSVYLKFFWFFHSYDLLRLKIHSWKNGIHSIILPGVDFFLLHFHLHFWFFSKIFSHFTNRYTYLFNEHKIAI